MKHHVLARRAHMLNFSGQKETDFHILCVAACCFIFGIWKCGFDVSITVGTATTAAARAESMQLANADMLVRCVRNQAEENTHG